MEYQYGYTRKETMHKNRQSQQIKQMPAGVKHYHAPAPEHKSFEVKCEGQKIKSMPPVSHYVGGGGSRNIMVNTKTINQKIR